MSPITEEYLRNIQQEQKYGWIFQYHAASMELQPWVWFVVHGPPRSGLLTKDFFMTLI
jgi:hypothetical protein